MLQTPGTPERNALLADAAAKAEYTRHLLNDFHALETLIRTDALEREVSRIGYELELNFVDRNCEPAFIGGYVVEELLRRGHDVLNGSRRHCRLQLDPPRVALRWHVVLNASRRH